MDEKLQQMREMIRQLNEASEAYYGGRDEIMTNYEWDAMFDALSRLEAETGIVLPDSPTHSVSTAEEESSGGSKEAHEFPALSLAKTKKVEELQDWAGDRPIWLSWKLDGLTLVLTYDGGKLTKILTRGNGAVGTNITYLQNAIKGFPLTLPYSGHLVVRGEATISYSEQGFTFRHNEAQPPGDNGFSPELGASLEGSLSATATLTATPRISLYGLLSVGLATDFNLTFALKAGVSSDDGAYGKLELTPGLKFTPVTASLGGIFSNKWDDYAPEVEFEPIWERYLFPSVRENGGLIGPYTNWNGSIYRVQHTGYNPETQQEYKYYTCYIWRKPYSVPNWVGGQATFHRY